MNLSSGSARVPAVIVEASKTSARIKTTINVRAGDALEIHTDELILLAEAINSTLPDSSCSVGVRLRHSIDHQKIAGFLSDCWSSLICGGAPTEAALP